MTDRPDPAAARRRRSSSARRRPQRGFTMIEILVASVLVAIAILGSWSVTSAVSAKQQSAATPVEAGRVAQEIYELAESLPRAPSGTPGVTAGGDVVALDSLVGARFSPPIFADGTADGSMSGWAQEVGLAIYALDDLSTPTGEDPAAGLDPLEPRLYELSVRVLESGSEVGTYRWWLTP